MLEQVQRLLAQARESDPISLIAAAAALLTEAVAKLAAPSAAPESPDLYNLTAAQAAPLVGMSARWLYDHAHELPYARRRGRCWRFSRTGIERAQN